MTLLRTLNPKMMVKMKKSTVSEILAPCYGWFQSHPLNSLKLLIFYYPTSEDDDDDDGDDDEDEDEDDEPQPKKQKTWAYLKGRRNHPKLFTTLCPFMPRHVIVHSFNSSTCIISMKVWSLDRPQDLILRYIGFIDLKMSPARSVNKLLDYWVRLPQQYPLFSNL